MIYRFAAIAVLLISLVSPSAAEGFFPFPHQQQKLANGLTLITIPTPSPGLIAYFTVVRTGSRDEVEAGRSGFAHFFEHMMFRGTKRLPGSAYDAIVTEMGAGQRPDQRRLRRSSISTFAKEDLERVIDIESDRFQHLSYGEPAFQTEAGAVYGEYRKDATDPWNFLDENCRDLAFDVAPLQAHGHRLRGRHQGHAARL